MKVYSYSEAQKKLSRILEEATSEGEVAIRKESGQIYILRPLDENDSPLNIKGVNVNLSIDDLNQSVRESREHK